MQSGAYSPHDTEVFERSIENGKRFFGKILGNFVISSDAPYEQLFIEGREYVFDGNRVTAHFRRGRNGIKRWRLHTVDPNLSMMVAEDLRVRKYPASIYPVRIIRTLETALDALRPLESAIADCEEHRHAWANLGCAQDCTDYCWNWCLICGAEQVWFPDTGEYLTWPENSETITERTAGALPTLHGPVLGGAL